MNTEVEEKVPTELELLIEKIAALEAEYDEDHNLWTKFAIEQLKVERDKWYDAEGKAIPVEPSSSELVSQFSPPAAVNATGEWIAVPTGIGSYVPWWIRNSKIDPSEGLRLSQNRSCGCFFIQNQVDTADRWINDSENAAKEYNCSARILAVAGYNMLGLRYMLPTNDLASVYGHSGYALTPEIPFNEEEKRIWSEMFIRYHFGHSALVGSKWQTMDVELQPNYPNAKDRMKVDPNGKHRMVTVPNNPQLIVPALMTYFNSNMFKKRAYSVALNTVHRIDANKMARVPGYKTVEEIGGERTRAWYDEFEDGASSAVPNFRPGSDF